MDASGQNYKDTFRYTDVEYTPDGHTDVYRWDDFLGIAGGHVYSAMDTIDMVSTGGQYEGDEPEHAYACEVVGCCGLSDGVALFRPVSHDGADLIQIAFLRNDVDDATGAYTERFEAGSFGQLAFIESTPAELQDDYPTPVHVFTYDGRDSEPVHRTDVHLDGDAMTLDPVKGTPAHNGAQAHGGDRHPADLAKAASAAANRTAGSHADEAGGIKH